ncbi:MAG: hypothetical protein ACPL7R_06090, partial [Anaerolineae bacterium]
MARRKDDGWIDLKADKRNTWLRILLIAAMVLLLGAALFLVLKGALAPREGQEPVAEKTPVVPHEARQESRLTLNLSPNESMRIGVSTLRMEAVLTDLNGNPLGGRKIAFTYNDEWNYAYYARTDAQGRATYDMPIVNDLLRSGFCGAGGFRNTASGYQAVAYFQGDAQYTGSRATGMFMVGSGGDAIPTRMEIVSVPSQVSRGDSVTVRVRLLDTQGKPLPAGRTIYFSGFYDQQSASTDADGYAQATLKASGAEHGNNTITAVFTGDIAQFAGAKYDGSAANRVVWVASPPRNVPKPPPIVYWMYDWRNVNPNDMPEYGPFGSMHFVTWDSIDGDFSSLRAYLDKASQMKITLPDGQQISKPVILHVYFYGAQLDGTVIDFTPERVKKLIGGSYILQAPGCEKPQVAPKYDDPKWQEEYRKLIYDLGREFGNDPRLAGVVIGIGFDGEAVATKNMWGCNFEGELQKYVTQAEFEQLLLDAEKWHREAFPNKPIYLAGLPYNVDFGATLNPPVGLKTNIWHPNSGALTYKSNAERTGESVIWLRRPLLPRAGETAGGMHIMPGPAGAYWMFLAAMSHKMDFMDIHSDVLGVFAAIPGFSNFVNTHLGKNVETTPSVWIALREAQDTT